MWAKNILLGLLFCCALYFSGKSAIQLWSYYALDQQTTAFGVKWMPQVKDEDTVYLEVSYEYQVNDVAYQGTMQTIGPVLRNAWAGERAAKIKNADQWKVWFDSKNPQLSSLIKTFPLKELIYSVILWGLTAYFYILGRYACAK